MKSVMTNRFAQTPNVNIPRSSFNRSHGYKTTFDCDKLIPIFLDEALPGDTFRLNMTGFARLNTPIYPLMDNMWMETFFFEVPMRLVWENWRKFMGERYPDPDSTIDYTIPTTTLATGAASGDNYDYLGIPVATTNSVTINNLPLRAINLIWNEWFRDQNLQNSVTVDTGDGPDTSTNYDTVHSVNKKHDYFTSALPWPQKGDAVDLPLGTQAPVKGIGKITNTGYVSGGTVYETGNSTTTTYANWIAMNTGTPTADQDFRLEEDPNNSGYPGIYADLTNATAATINDLREAFQIQKLLERDARGGTRYIEIIRSHFGVSSPDGRAWRPVYLGGGKSMVNITPIAQTSSTDVTSPQGNLAAMGTAGLRNHGFTKSFTEHSLVLGFVAVRADLTYSQGINRLWNRSTRYDYYWPALAQIGEQAVLNKEIYADQTTVNQDAVFGYQERYAEYRYKPSMITGKMRPGLAGGDLSAWHLSEEFSTAPALNSTFITSNTPMARVTAVNTEPDFLFDSYFEFNCARPMPLYGIPGMIDHF